MDNFDYDPILFRERLLRVANEKQNRIAEKIDRSGSDLSNWFNISHPSKPQIKDLIKIATVYNCSIDYLLGVDEIVGKRSYTYADFAHFLDFLVSNYLATIREHTELKPDIYYDGIGVPKQIEKEVNVMSIDLDCSVLGDLAKDYNGISTTMPNNLELRRKLLDLYINDQPDSPITPGEVPS